ncbi:hypothetical protein ACPCSL_23110 [Streptomyces griseoincarnatus]
MPAARMMGAETDGPRRPSVRTRLVVRVLTVGNRREVYRQVP